MRPLKIEFQAFGPYRGHETVDFEALSSKGLFLICGKTGSGKTTILDAMTFALYGRSSGHGRDDLGAMRCTGVDFGTDTFVRFIFENSGHHYLFERRLEPKRKNLSAAYSLMERDGDGVWSPLFENPKDKDLNKKAVEITGLEYEQFRQVIVLPQGQFEKLLTSHSEEKEMILRSIFGEERWQNIAECFYEEAENRRNELKSLKERILRSLSEEECGSFEELNEKTVAERNALSELDRAYSETDREKLIKEQQELLTLSRRFSDLRKAAEGLAFYERNKEERLSLERKLKDAERADKVRLLLNDLKEAERTLKKRQGEEEERKRSEADKQRAAEEASDRLKAHLADQEAVEEKRALIIRYENTRTDYESVSEGEKNLKKKRKLYSEAALKEKSSKEACDMKAEEIIYVRGEYARLQAEHNDLLDRYIKGITGEIAEKLKDGEPCPVCGSMDHPRKAETAEDRVSEETVRSKKEERDKKYEELQERIASEERAKKEHEELHAAALKAESEAVAAEAELNTLKKKLVPGIGTLEELLKETEAMRKSVGSYGEKLNELKEAEKKAQEEWTEARAGVGSALKEVKDAGEHYEAVLRAAEKGLSENGFASREEADAYMLSTGEQQELSGKIADFDAGLRAAENNLNELKKELHGIEEPDREKCQEILDNAVREISEHREKRALILNECERLEKKAAALKAEGEGIEERIREAEQDFGFAKRLRGDTGTGLQRYVLGIMFSSVVAAANKMLELVHGGRYRLYRSDEKAKGNNKRGLELKVFDRYSSDHEGRFVSTLSGGEKFLASLALSIGMSTVAQKSGIRIEALFIDEGFGSLDEDSIEDAMNILNSIREANGLVGIISHVRLLEDQIPSKIRVREDEDGSHLSLSVG